MDQLAWNLGDPCGSMQALTVTANGVTTAIQQAHPMKGPMTTQTLRGLKGLEPLHWRGDRASFLDFNSAFASLMGGEPLSMEDMRAYKEFIETIVFPANPHRNLNNSLPATLGSGDPRAGENYFRNVAFLIPGVGQSVQCASCHGHPAGVAGTRSLSIVAAIAGIDLVQATKIPQLRNIYQKVHFDNAPDAESLAGFGLEHDGVKAGLAQAHSGPRFVSIEDNTTVINNLTAFLLCFDTGTPPAVGYDLTVGSENLDSVVADGEWDALEREAASGRIDVIAKGNFGGLLYDPARRNYISDTEIGLTLSREEIQSQIASGATVMPMGVPRGAGRRMGIDRDLDGFLDGLRPKIALPAPEFITDPGTFGFLLGGPPGLDVMLQRSTDLLNWEDWQKRTIVEIPLLLSDRDAAIHPRLYYRARAQGASPWRFAHVTGNARSSRLYIFLNKAGTVLIDDIKLVAGPEAGVGANHVFNGDFESALDDAWIVPPNYRNTMISTTMALTGNGSLSLAANGPSIGLTTVILQDMLPITTNTTYTLSHWYLTGTNNLDLTVRLSDNSLSSTVSILAR